jgi:hypothetical protein
MPIPKLCIGPMSKEIVDCIIDFTQSTGNIIWFIPSRRQIEYNGGYVNNWTTEKFFKYVRYKSSVNILIRDHGGPGQGLSMDDGVKSILCDAHFMDGIHIDPWKQYKNLDEAASITADLMTLCYDVNDKLFFEIGTEQAIRSLSVDEMESFILKVKDKVKPVLFDRILYFVIQSGTGLKENHNVGTYDKQKLSDMIALCRKFGFKSKEHNGDYISNKDIKDRFDGGLDTLNIAPEFGYIQTRFVLNEISSNDELYNKMFKICFDSNKWRKWVDDDFKPYDRKDELILICGHYVFSHPEIKSITDNIVCFEERVKLVIKQKLQDYFEVLSA